MAALAALSAAVLAAQGMDGSGEDAGNPTLHAGAVESMRHGGDYYPVVADALRSGDGIAGPFAFPPPTLAAVAARLPDWALSALLVAVAIGVLAAWRPVLARALARPAARWGACLLLVAGLVPYSPSAVLYVPEVWAGLFATLSLARWARGAQAEATAWGLCAAVLAPGAGVYLLVMLAFAVAAGVKRDAAGWAVALGVLAAATAVHRRAVLGVLGPIAGVARPPIDLDPLAQASAVGSLPFAPALLTLAGFGWLAWRGGAGVRLAATVWATAAVAALRPDLGGDWGYLVAAPVLAGLAFVPDAVRDLWRAAVLGRRRITVTRVVR